VVVLVAEEGALPRGRVVILDGQANPLVLAGVRQAGKEAVGLQHLHQLLRSLLFLTG